MRGRVLVVDDETSIARLFATMLEGAGYEVETADSGPSAIACIEAACPDLVLLDLMMPGMDGFTVVERIDPLPCTPLVVFVSGRHEVAEQRRSLPECVVGFLAKPVRVRDLLATCELALTPAPLVPAGVLERRQVPRRLLITEVSVLSSTGDPLLTGRLVRLSTRGAEIQMDARFDQGQHLRILLPAVGTSQSLAVGAELLYRRPMGEAFAYGMAFVGNSTTEHQVEELLGVGAA